MRNQILGTLISSALVAGCGGTMPATTDSGGNTEKPLDPPLVGMQLKTTPITIDAGSEQYSCWSFLVPSDRDISLVQLANQIPAAGVHHFAVFTSSKPLTNAGPWECSMMDGSWGLVNGGGVGTPSLSFPDGAAMTLKAGQHLIFQLHLLNASAKALDVPPAYMNLVGTKASGLQEVGLIIAGTLDIKVPAHSTDQQFSGGCAVSGPLQHVFAYFPHMHQHGKRITAQIQHGTDAPTMFSDHVWNFADQGVYAATGTAQKGDQITITCTYDNPLDKPIVFGESTNNEMCIQVLFYYPALDPTHPSQYCGF